MWDEPVTWLISALKVSTLFHVEFEVTEALLMDCGPVPNLRLVHLHHNRHYYQTELFILIPSLVCQRSENEGEMVHRCWNCCLFVFQSRGAFRGYFPLHPS